MPDFTANSPEGTTHVTIWNTPPEYRWFDSEEAAQAFARRVAADGGRGVEVREVGR